MNYGSLIQDAWTMTWRHRFLWVLGLFATTSVGACSGSGGGLTGWRADSRDLERLPRGASAAVLGSARWVADTPGAAAAGVAVLVLLVLALVVVSLIAQGGMAQATADLARGRPSSSGRAWRTGLRLFWRYLALWLLMIAVAIVVAVVVGVLVATAIGASSLASTGVRIVLAALATTLAVAAFLASIPLAIAISIVVAYAQRAIAVEDVGPVAALQSGLLLLRNHLGTTLLVWLINLGLSIGAAIVIAVAVLALAVPLVALGVIFYAAVGFATPTIVYAAIAVLVAIAALWGLSAIANTYFWSYWTIAYLRLTGQLATDQ